MDNVMLEAASGTMAEMLTPLGAQAPPLSAQAPSRGVSLDGDPDPRQDAIHLNTAFKGRGKNVPEIINILAHRDVTQRAEIQEAYKAMYSEDLKQRLSQELGFAGDVSENLGVNISGDLNGELFGPLSSNIKKAVMLWMLDPAERDATIVGQALTLTSLDLIALTEVICSRTPSEIRLFKKAYFQKYGTQINDDLDFKTYTYHKKLLIACLNAERDEGTVANQSLAEEDAKKLYKEGEGKWGTDEKTFIHIFTQRNRAHLAAVASVYQHLYGNSLAKAVENETSGNFKFGLLTLLRCAENPAKYFAEVLYEAMKGLGTRDTTLIRVMVTRAEIDMNYIKDEYAKIDGKSLRDAIQSNTSGDYRTFLIYLSGPIDAP
ncbi:annexin D5-like isoform X1 [Magnolia sinica]|uniref:annexin D5-like isoform X1 n=1 Tax=Magnolia sinica TaxID=86752 RepID=UPI00265B017C|nr:annexin D5-like isoform X1 [Magnolia sinica]